VAKTPTVVDLSWLGDLKFSAAAEHTSITLDTAGVEGPSPVQTLAIALAGCMAMDVVHVITRGRHPLRGLRAHLVGDRAEGDPHRLVRVALQFTVEGDVPRDAVDRAVQLSRDKYCSVWHSMRQDIDFNITVEIVS
jgi:putative redox protein